jgi:hypothetical protein
VTGNAEEVVDGLVADRQLAASLEAERFVESDRAFRIRDSVAGVDELHDAILDRRQPLGLPAM